MFDAPLIWGLDISKSRTGFAEGRAGEAPHVTSIVGSDMDDVKAMSKLFCYLRDRLKLARPDFIYFEAPLDGGIARPEIDWEKRDWHYTRSPKTTLVLAKMTGAVELFADLASIPARPVRVKTVRVEFIGSGNLKGPEAKRRAFAMCGLLNWPVKNLDEADALAVWHYGTVIASPRHARAILSSMHAQVATLVAGVDVEKPLFRRRA